LSPVSKLRRLFRMVQCPEQCKICAQPATLETVLPQKSDDPDVIRITGCACGDFTADREWWYMEADTQRTASPTERFARLSSALRTNHEAGKPAHLASRTWSDLAPPTPPSTPPKPSKSRKVAKPR
jgi:hypothetical protein